MNPKLPADPRCRQHMARRFVAIILAARAVGC